MNLTYLCYGSPKIYEWMQELKGFGQKDFYSGEMLSMKENTVLIKGIGLRNNGKHLGISDSRQSKYLRKM